MSILQQDESSLDIALGQVLRLPCKFIKGKSSANPALIKAISQQLSTRGKNILPVVVKAVGEDDYQVTLNAHIVEAARKAKLDFVWCIIVDDQMQAQVQIESGQLPQSQVNVLTASEQEIIDALKYIQAHRKGFNTIKPEKVAEAIADYRKTKKPRNLLFLTSLRCGIGKTKIPTLGEFLTVT
jgi:hypothetical protein